MVFHGPWNFNRFEAPRPQLHGGRKAKQTLIAMFKLELAMIYPQEEKRAFRSDLAR